MMYRYYKNLTIIEHTDWLKYNFDYDDFRTVK